MASLMLGTRFVGGVDDASTLVEIFSAVVSIFKHVFLYSGKKGLFSSWRYFYLLCCSFYLQRTVIVFPFPDFVAFFKVPNLSLSIVFFYLQHILIT
jgi:hypothetical protein